MSLDKRLVRILACPECKGILEYIAEVGNESLTCNECKLRYRVEDNIPIMLAEKADKL